MLALQPRIGDTVILNYSCTGMCSVFDSMGLELFSYFLCDCPEVMHQFIETSVETELRWIHAVADPDLSPVILISEDCSAKTGPIFDQEFLSACHYPCVKKLADAWHEHGIKVIYHSDGNYRDVIANLIKCGVDGFYCLEPAGGMDILALKKEHPQMVWTGGLDGVDLMERGTPEQVRAEVHRHIRQSNALQTGGMFLATSREINPPVKPEKFRAMLNAAGAILNDNFES